MKTLKPLVKIRPKFQVTIPDRIRHQMRLEVGDILEIGVFKNHLVLKPQVILDKEAIDVMLDERLKELEAGKVTPAFNTMEEFRAYLAKNK